MIVVMTKLELVRILRKIATSQGCHLTLRAALAIADFIRGNAVNTSDGIPIKKKEENDR